MWIGDDFRLRESHEEHLRALLGNPSHFHRAAARIEVLDLLKRITPHLVYFYCHGGWDEDARIPFLLVGRLGERGITPDNLGWQRIWWEVPQPLVVINGCHTTALEPSKAIDFVSAFIEDAHASGVIGTEVSVFEPLACAFAEALLERFLVGTPIGEAVRLARLALLKAHNPLGLVYVPYVIANLELIHRTNLRDISP
jgi:hypothetical protein